MSDSDNRNIRYAALMSMAASAFLAVVSFFDSVPAYATMLPAFPFGVGLGLWVRAKVWKREDDYDDPYPTLPRSKATTEDQAFCSDCGKRYQLRRSMRGFNGKTGAPAFQYALGCPDGDPGRPKGGGSMGSLFVSGFYFDWPNCGTTKTSKMLSASHDHGDRISVSCPGCLDDMFQNGVIDLPTMTKFIDELRK